MNLKADLFPYPVLTPELDDYLDNNSFDAQINVNPESSGVISVAADFRLDNQGLKELVDSGNALYALHVEGVASSYRKLWTNNEDQTFIRNTIFEGDIRKKLQINAMVIANAYTLTALCLYSYIWNIITNIITKMSTIDISIPINTALNSLLHLYTASPYLNENADL